MMGNSAYCYFERNMTSIKNALSSLDKDQFDSILFDCVQTIKNKNKIVVSGLGKNVPICEKFVGTMISMGLDANFLNTNSAIHGDMGMIHSGDLVIILTKSGATRESIQLVEYLKQRSGLTLWLLTFSENSPLFNTVDKKLIMRLDDEGDLWNIMPNNSSTINLIVLQNIAIKIAESLKLELEINFKPNHPGGIIGEKLNQ